MTDSQEHGPDGYGPPPSAPVAEVRDQFFGWPRPIQDQDSKTNPPTREG